MNLHEQLFALNKSRIWGHRQLSRGGGGGVKYTADSVAGARVGFLHL